MKHKHLAHIDGISNFQFITFRTYDSVDSYVRSLEQKDLAQNRKQLVMDQYLDSSSKGSYLNGDCLKALYNFLISKNNIFFELISFSIMPNHVHLLLKPLEKLSIVIQRVKGGNARMINLLLDRKGKFWANDYFDRYIRDQKHFLTVYHYIKDNPLKLKNEELRFYSIYE